MPKEPNSPALRPRRAAAVKAAPNSPALQPNPNSPALRPRSNPMSPALNAKPTPSQSRRQPSTAASVQTSRRSIARAKPASPQSRRRPSVGATPARRVSGRAKSEESERDDGPQDHDVQDGVETNVGTEESGSDGEGEEGKEEEDEEASVRLEAPAELELPGSISLTASFAALGKSAVFGEVQRGARSAQETGSSSDESGDDNNEDEDQMSLEALQACSFMVSAIDTSTETTASASPLKSKGLKARGMVDAVNAAGAIGAGRTPAKKAGGLSQHAATTSLKSSLPAAPLRSLAGLKARRNADVERLMCRALPTPAENAPVLHPGTRAARVPDDVRTRGDKWFGMKASPMTQDAKYTLELLANRHAIDPKRHYRKEAKQPKGSDRMFQIGTVIAGAGEFFARTNKRDRRPNLAADVVNDDRLRPYIKRKFAELQDAAQNKGKRAFKNKDKKRKPKWNKGASAKQPKHR